MSEDPLLAGFLAACYYAVSLRQVCGEVREWPIRRAWKARVPAMVPWVRIPPSPPYHNGAMTSP